MSTDSARLTDAEREDLWRAYESWTEGDFSEHMGEAVEGILGKRLHPPPEGANVVQRIVNAWDCCGTCAGGVLAAYVREQVENALEGR